MLPGALSLLSDVVDLQDGRNEAQFPIRKADPGAAPIDGGVIMRRACSVSWLCDPLWTHRHYNHNT